MLALERLTRTFGDLVALHDVSFDVVPGRITGFVGANGAGKTTTMRIAMGVLSADSGEVTWDGTPVTTTQRRSFGYMPEERGLYPKMKLAEQLSFFGRLHGLSSTRSRTRATELLDRLGLGGRAEEVLESLSLGNQQRVQVAAALMHRPTALILDEPFSGLDPLAVEVMIELLSEEAADRPMLFSSHQLDLVERISDDLIILSEGRVVAAGRVEDLRNRQPQVMRVRYARPPAQPPPASRPGPSEGAYDVDLGDRAAPAALAELQAFGEVASYAPVVSSLAEIYREAIS